MGGVLSTDHTVHINIRTNINFCINYMYHTFQIDFVGFLILILKYMLCNILNLS